MDRLYFKFYCILIVLLFISVFMPQFLLAKLLIDEPISPIPIDNKLDQKKVLLGKKLFHDTRLSKNNTISCASCHSLEKGGADGRQFPVGINGSIGETNSPTVLNSGFNFRQFWDGRAQSLEEQVEGPINHPKEMGSSWPKVISKLKKDKTFSKNFEKIYKKGITKNNIKNAIAEFERSLSTPNSSFDKYLRGDAEALNKNEKKGYQLFKSNGCISCHQGVAVGGNMFQKLGVVKNYFDPKTSKQIDLGRFNITKIPSDKHVFKVPSLRNVELTAPYFHDGSIKSLKEAVKIMAEYQIGRVLNDKDCQLIVDFLKSLTGEIEKETFK